MSGAPLDALIATERALIAALDADDIDAIARHSGEVEQAILHVRAAGTTGVAGRREQAEEALRLADAARVRLNVLSDMTDRSLARLSSATGRGRATATYGRNGRLTR